MNATATNPAAGTATATSGRTRLVIGNWKMNPPTLTDAKKIFSKIKQLSVNTPGQLVVCPPATYLYALSSSYKGKKITFGAQDAYWQNNGSLTGYLGPTMAESAGAKYLIRETDLPTLGELQTGSQDIPAFQTPVAS